VVQLTCSSSTCNGHSLFKWLSHSLLRVYACLSLSLSLDRSRSLCFFFFQVFFVVIFFLFFLFDIERRRRRFRYNNNRIYIYIYVVCKSKRIERERMCFLIFDVFCVYQQDERNNNASFFRFFCQL